MTITSKDYSAGTGLPKKTRSLCPECVKLLDADIVARDNKVYMEK